MDWYIILYFLCILKSSQECRWSCSSRRSCKCAKKDYWGSWFTKLIILWLTWYWENINYISCGQTTVWVGILNKPMIAIIIIIIFIYHDLLWYCHNIDPYTEKDKKSLNSRRRHHHHHHYCSDLYYYHHHNLKITLLKCVKAWVMAYIFKKIKILILQM